MFQSTHPSRGATFERIEERRRLFVSIHAPLAGCDANGSSRALSRGCFNPRTPRGVRHTGAYRSVFVFAFQSTHPSRGATWPRRASESGRRGFNPRTPRGVRHLYVLTVLLYIKFQSTHPSRGATFDDGKDAILVEVSIHAPLAGCDGKRSHKGNILPRIYGCYSPQIRFFSAVRPTPLLWHGSSTYILSCDFLFTSPSRS